MKYISLSLSLIILCCVYANAQNCAFPNQLSKCCGATSFSDCPDVGCGGDSLLNARKNITAIPDPGSVEDWQFNDVLNVLFPASWSSGIDRAQLTAWGEGKAVRIKARLKKVQKYASGKETTNCNLKLEANNDYHVVLTRVKDKPESQSITAEISPRIRPSGWTYTKLNELRKTQPYVRITGYLMLDTQHLGDAHPARYTHWEIHPVTAFEVCTGTKVKCDNGEGWISLAEMPEP